MENLQIVDLPVIEEVNQGELSDIYGGITLDYGFGVGWEGDFPFLGGTLTPFFNISLSDSIDLFA